MALTKQEFVEHCRIAVGIHVGRLGQAYRGVHVDVLLGKVYEALVMCGIEFERRPPAVPPSTRSGPG